jgi:hypothetical protein
MIVGAFFCSIPLIRRGGRYIRYNKEEGRPIMAAASIHEIDE